VPRVVAVLGGRRGGAPGCRREVHQRHAGRGARDGVALDGHVARDVEADAARRHVDGGIVLDGEGVGLLDLVGEAVGRVGGVAGAVPRRVAPRARPAGRDGAAELAGAGRAQVADDVAAHAAAVHAEEAIAHAAAVAGAGPREAAAAVLGQAVL